MPFKCVLAFKMKSHIINIEWEKREEPRIRNFLDVASLPQQEKFKRISISGKNNWNIPISIKVNGCENIYLETEGISEIINPINVYL